MGDQIVARYTGTSVHVTLLVMLDSPDRDNDTKSVRDIIRSGTPRGQVSPTTFKNSFSLVLQSFLYIEAFESKSVSYL